MARQQVFGLPIGKKQPTRAETAKKFGAAAAVFLAPIVAVPAARRLAPVARKARDVTHGAQDLVHKGEDVAGTVSEVMDTASNVKQAVSSHSSTIGKVGGVVKAVAQHGKSDGDGGGKPRLSHLIEQHTDIAASRSTVYNQWTQLEMFPTLVKGIEAVDQEEDDKAKWTAKIGPSRRTWTGHIVEQVPDERIAWKSEGGASLQGVVTFHSLDEDLTRVLLQMEYKPSGAVEWVGNTLRIQRRRAKRDLRLFKHFIEMRGEETGAWRGRIDGEEKLEPQFAGQTDHSSRDRNRRSSRSEEGRSQSTRSSSRGAQSSGDRRQRRSPSQSSDDSGRNNGRTTEPSGGRGNSTGRSGSRNRAGSGRSSSRRNSASSRSDTGRSSGRSRRSATGRSGSQAASSGRPSRTGNRQRVPARSGR